MLPRKLGVLRDAALLVGLAPIGLGLVGCRWPEYVDTTPPPPLGSGVDQIMKTQEENAEAWKYTVYMHEFELNEVDVDGNNIGGWRLNEAGEDHVRQIAVNMKRGDQYPVVIERSDTSAKPGTRFNYPVHYNDALDSKRRQVVVAVLTSMGVPDADRRVIVAPAASEGIEATAAAREYGNSLNRNSGRGGGMGGGMGGMGGGGFF
ncbi:MAG: hypothetical protein U0939_10965 [Pirellulales bacterium]